MSKEVNEGRRSALKKLGLTTGAVYVAPAVTALVVPQHATATSSSVANTFPTGTTVSFVYDSSGPVWLLQIRTPDNTTNWSSLAADVDGTSFAYSSGTSGGQISGTSNYFYEWTLSTSGVFGTSPGTTHTATIGSYTSGVSMSV